MYLNFKNFYKFLIILKEKITNNLIQFFTKYEMMNLLCFLIILNLKKIKEISPRDKIKYKSTCFK